MLIKSLIKLVVGFGNYGYNKILLKYNKAQVGKNLIIKGRVHCISNSIGGIVIGNNVKINSSLSSNPIGGDRKTILFAKGTGKIIIGNDVGISNSTIFSCKQIVIEDNVLIGGSVKIYDTDFHWLDPERRKSEKNGESRAVKISKSAFIGGHSIILKGVTIGSKSVIGAGSVVTKDVPDFELWAGNPAKFIRKLNI